MKIFTFVIGFALMAMAMGCGGGGGTGQPPVAEFTISADSGFIPLVVEFDASASNDSDGNIVQYAWQFGDGNTGSGASVTHTYTAAGTYTAQLTVTDDSGLADTASRNIVAQDPGTHPTYTISGTVRSAAYMITDSDVNDANTVPVPNNSFDQAQLIRAPIAISGYVNVAGAGEDGNSKTDGDPDDYFLVTLTQGLKINLAMVEDPPSVALNLYLYDDQQTLKDASLTDGVSGIASLTVPEDGTYYVRVEAVADDFTQSASVYALTIGQTSIPAEASPLRLSDDFVTDEVLVRINKPAESRFSALAADAAGLSAMGFSTRAGASGLDRLLRRSHSVNGERFFNGLGVARALERSLAPGMMSSTARSKMETLWMVRALRKHPGVDRAEPNYIRKPLLVPDDTYYSYQWHYPLINLPGAWDITTGSSDVVVAVVDTGVLLAHPDLNGQLIAGYDFISDPGISLDGDGVDANPDDPGDQEDVNGSSFHGTHIAGTIAAASSNGTGVAGIAWNARIMPLRVLGFGGGTSFDIIQAVKYAAGMDTDYAGIRLDQPVDVINLSLGGSSFSQIEADVYAAARAKGVIIVAAAGNSANTDPLYPAAYDGVVSVSAVTIEGSFASYSSYGDTIDLSAPGGSSTDINGDGYMDGVLSSSADDSSGAIQMGYAFSKGTSMAAPHVSGVIALMKALYPGMTPDDFDTWLQGGYLTTDLGDAGRDNRFGYGLIDAQKAVMVAQNGGVVSAILSVSPSHLNFGTALTSSAVSVENGGNTNNTLTVTNFFTDAAWLSIEPSGDVDADGLGTYTVQVDRQGLSDGTYSGTATFESSANPATISVVMQVGTANTTSDGGYHYILLLDSVTLETKGQVEGKGDKGTYAYRFSGLSAGDTVIIYAGTDPNNDGFICDDGEACGAYLSLNQPVELTVSADMTDIDFLTDIHLNLPTATTRQATALALPLQRDVLKEIAK